MQVIILRIKAEPDGAEKGLEIGSGIDYFVSSV
jgi:hypothetical protein